MTDDLFLAAKRVFQEVLDVPEGERASRIDELCAGDPGLRAEVESLLEHDAGEADHELEGVRQRSQDAEPWIGRRLGAWEIDGMLGRGGMGTVYSARRVDGAFDQHVAIKTLSLGVLDPRGIERFERERRILASLDHPNIARILDGGASDEGLPYLVMEHVDGVPIDVYCNRRELSIRARLDLFRHVCAAVGHAHGRLVLHRDIKASNVLVTEDGRPKLLDFGIAKALGEDGDSDVTRQGGAPLTPHYAAPEQLRGEPLSTATDLYQLGALLYLLLSGSLPFADSDGVGDLISQVLDREPSSPGDVLRTSPRTGGKTQPSWQQPAGVDGLPRELDDIVLMALRKEPERRYASVTDFLRDIDRHLQGLPVRAHRGTQVYRAGKFVRRNRLPVGLSALVAASLVFGLVSTRLQSHQVAREAERVEAINGFLQQTLSAADPFRMGADVSLHSVLRGAAANLDTAFVGDDDVRSGLLTAVGLTYVNQGLFSEGARLLDSALVIHERRNGPYSREASDAYGGMVFALGRQGVVEELAAVASEVISGYEVRYGRSDPLALRLRGPLAMAQFHMGESAAALAGLDSALTVAQGTLGDDHPATLRLMSYLSTVLVAESQRRDESVELALTAARGLRARGFMDPEDLDALALALDGLARIGEVEVAEELARDLLSEAERLWGPGHLATTIPRQRLALVLSQANAFEEASEHYRAAYEDAQGQLPKDNIQRMFLQADYGTSLGQIGRFDEAEPLQREALDFYLERLGADAPLTNMARLNLAWIVLGTGDASESRDLLTETVERMEEPGGLVYWYALTVLIDAIIESGDPAAAVELALSRLSRARAELAPDSQTLNRLLSVLARGQLQAGQEDEAERLLLEVRANYLSGRADDASHPDVQWATSQLIRFYRAIGREAEAERLSVGG